VVLQAANVGDSGAVLVRLPSASRKLSPMDPPAVVRLTAEHKVRITACGGVCCFAHDTTGTRPCRQGPSMPMCLMSSAPGWDAAALTMVQAPGWSGCTADPRVVACAAGGGAQRACAPQGPRVSGEDQAVRLGTLPLSRGQVPQGAGAPTAPSSVEAGGVLAASHPEWSCRVGCVHAKWISPGQSTQRCSHAVLLHTSRIWHTSEDGSVEKAWQCAAHLLYTTAACTTTAARLPQQATAKAPEANPRQPVAWTTHV
jgi:hypothetical protein